MPRSRTIFPIRAPAPTGAVLFFVPTPYAKGQSPTLITAPLTAITAAVVGMIINLAVFFAAHTFWPKAAEGSTFSGPIDWLPAVVAVAAFLALWKYKADIIKVIGVCALIGLVYTLAMA